MDILILSPNQIDRRNWTHQLFRNEFSKHHNVTYYGEGYKGYIPGKPIPEVIKDKHFDILFTYGMKYTEPFVGIGDVKIPKAHLAVDYFPDATSGTYERNKKLFDRDKYDIYFGVVGDIVKNLELNKVCSKAHLLPFSIDIDIYKKLNLPKIYDIFAVFTTRSDTYPNRVAVQSYVASLPKAFIKAVQHENYIRKINESKICVTSNNKFKSLSIKYVEVMSCGSLLFADLPEDLYELGYVPGKHLVLYNDLQDLKNKINYYLKNTSKAESIALEGMNFVRTNHNNSVRVKQFTEIVKKELGI